MELFDVLRLDHFRAFAGYWAVPAHETTARNGTWKTGPGADLFETLENELGPLPFIAEDLGDIDKAVHDLRIKFQMPGMKVLQFAFGGNFATSDYIPHNFSENFVVYTGTHDNNTTRGWFKNDAGKIERENLKKYFQQSITAEKINPLLIRLAFSSVARIAITPAQDLLGLDEKSRMNAPATTLNNWQWRMLAGNPERSTEAWLKEQTLLYNRF